jgi:hypothetical protein
MKQKRTKWSLLYYPTLWGLCLSLFAQYCFSKAREAMNRFIKTAIYRPEGQDDEWMGI